MKPVPTGDRLSARRRAFVATATVAIAAVACRFLCVALIESRLADDPGRRFVVAGDAEGYWLLAGKLVAGEPFEIYEPPRRVLRMPGLPLLLASVRAIAGDAVTPARCVLAVVGVAACALTAVAGWRLAGPFVGLGAGALAAVSPLFVAFSPLLLSETLFAGVMTAAVVVTRESIVSSSKAVAIAAGTLHAAATLVRPTWVLVPPVVVAGWCLLCLRRRGGPAAYVSPVLLCAGFAAGMTPWVVRNFVVTGSPVLTTLWAGPSLYDGLNPDATGASDMTFFEADGLPSTLSEAEVNREYTRRAVAFAAENPARVLTLAVEKLKRFWNPFLNAGGFADGAAGLVIAAFEAGLFAAAAVGIWVKRRDAGFLLVTCGPTLFFAAVHAFFVGSVRYRVPGEYLLTVAAAVGLVAVTRSAVLVRLERLLGLPTAPGAGS